MKTTFTKEGTTLTVNVEGNLDTITAPELESQLQEHWDGIRNLILDFSAVEYVSSAGIRAVLVANRHMLTCGSLTLLNVHADIREVFEMTGFDSLLNFAEK